MTADRTTPFRRNTELEALLGELAGDLAPCEAALAARENAQSLDRPLILVMGPLRSGTTLLLQWLGASGIARTPTNLLSRFFATPIIGAKIQLLLTDPRYSFRDELADFGRGTDFSSENGKTRGTLAPNEFWYFWRRFLADPGRDLWSDRELHDTVDTGRLRAELNGIMRVFGAPLAAKGALFNYNIPFVAQALDKVLFLHTRRDPAANVESALAARERQLGSVHSWYSFDIPERAELAALPPEDQVAGQIYYSHRAIERGLAGVGEANKLTVDYEDFCADPARYHEEISGRLACLGHRVDEPYRGPAAFAATRKDAAAPSPAIAHAVARFW